MLFLIKTFFLCLIGSVIRFSWMNCAGNGR